MTKTTAAHVGVGGAMPPKKGAHLPKSKGRRESCTRDFAAPDAVRPTAFGAVCHRVPDFYVVPAFRGMPVDAQRAAVLLWTHGDTPLYGIVRDASVKVSGALGISPGRARSMLAALAHAGFIRVCDEADLVWLPGYIEGQLGGSPKRTVEWTVATVRSINRLPQTALVDAYRAYHRLPMDVPATSRKAVEKQGGVMGVSVGVRVGDTERATDGAYVGAMAGPSSAIRIEPARASGGEGMHNDAAGNGEGGRHG